MRSEIHGLESVKGLLLLLKSFNEWTKKVDRHLMIIELLEKNSEIQSNVFYKTVTRNCAHMMLKIL